MSANGFNGFARTDMKRKHANLQQSDVHVPRLRASRKAAPHWRLDSGTDSCQGGVLCSSWRVGDVTSILKKRRRSTRASGQLVGRVIAWAICTSKVRCIAEHQHGASYACAMRMEWRPAMWQSSMHNVQSFAAGDLAGAGQTINQAR